MHNITKAVSHPFNATLNLHIGSQLIHPSRSCILPAALLQESTLLQSFTVGDQLEHTSPQDLFSATHCGPLHHGAVLRLHAAAASVVPLLLCACDLPMPAR